MEYEGFVWTGVEKEAGREGEGTTNKRKPGHSCFILAGGLRRRREVPNQAHGLGMSPAPSVLAAGMPTCTSRPPSAVCV